MNYRQYGLNRITKLWPLILLAIVIPVVEAETVDELSWGNNPELTSPEPDSKGRGGSWWWPAVEKSDNAALGNRGKVFSRWDKSEPETPVIISCPGPPTPPDQPAQIITCYALVLNNILFTFDGTELRPEAKAELSKVSAEMKKYPKDTVLCVGHTDDVGPEDYNKHLGYRRAQAAVDYLISQGIAAGRLTAKSMGEKEPAVPNDSRMNRALNRRVVFEFTVVN